MAENWKFQQKPGKQEQKKIGYISGVGTGEICLANSQEGGQAIFLEITLETGETINAFYMGDPDNLVGLIARARDVIKGFL